MESPGLACFSVADQEVDSFDRIRLVTGRDRTYSFTSLEGKKRMTDEILPFGSQPYFILLAMLTFARGMDFFSTWVATPNLMLEGNPIAKRLGWRGGMLFNLAFCVAIPVWPLPTIMVSVMSLLVAAHNFQNAWIMRSMGETQYAIWIHERMMNCPPALFVFCLVAQSGLTALVGALLMLVSNERSIMFAVGAGVVGYAIALLVFSLLSMWRIRRA
jgi:hypothetical protein